MCSARFGGDIHASLDAQVDGEHSLLDQLEAPAAELASGSGAEQLPAAQATALRLTLLEGLSLRAAGLKLGISAMAVQRAQKKAIAALRLQLVGGG
jgi:DNA-directed RNA polymerase specialized sigma24 family protein